VLVEGFSGSHRFEAKAETLCLYEL
jgi:hypothetical protein